MSDSVFQSVLAPFIEEFLATKRALGYRYNSEENVLKRFDRYWMAVAENSETIDETSMEKWLRQSSTEGKSSLEQRINTVKQFCLYMNGIGKNAYVPNIKVHRNKPLIHVFTREEMKELFHVIDSFIPVHQSPDVTRMAEEYPVIFRLYASTGLRRTEAVTLRYENINWDNRSITILNAKGRKDRVVFLSEDMTGILRNYSEKIRETYRIKTQWLFPAVDVSKHLSSGALSIRFRAFWNQTECAGHCEKRPTIHSFRHTFVVFRVNLWMKQGSDTSVLMPYLSRYLGHKSEQETYYYYHQVLDAFELIRKQDDRLGSVMPEVRVR